MLFQHLLSLSCHIQSMLGTRNPLPSFSNFMLTPKNIIHVAPMQIDYVNFSFTHLNGFHAKY